MAKAKKAKRSPRMPHKLLHKDGSLWARGYMKGEAMDGPWKWFRKDGRIVKVTRMGRKA